MLVIAGESLIDLIAQPKSSDKLYFSAHAGGSPYNMSIALARLGQNVGFLCPFSKDNFGEFLLEPLKRANITPLYKKRVNSPSSLALVNIDEQGNAEYQFYRHADRDFDEQELLSSLPQNIELFHLGGFCAIEEIDQKIWLNIAKIAKEQGAVISIDANVRPFLVDNFLPYRRRLYEFFAICDIIKMSDEDLLALTGSKEIEGQAQEFLKLPNCKLVVISKGKEGSFAMSKKAMASEKIYLPSKFGDTIGAGDSLMAGIIARLKEINLLTSEKLALLNEKELINILSYAAIVAGLNCAHFGANPPLKREIDLILKDK